MKINKFIRVKAKLSGFSLIHGLKYTFPSNTEIIANAAKKGYSYKGFVPVEQVSSIGLKTIDLVFEKEISDSSSKS